MSFLINTPPTLDGDNAAKILQLYKHLYKMSEEVNYALNALASGNVVDLTGTTDARKIFSTAIMGGNVTANTPSVETYNELKSLIIKTGNAIEKSKASIELVLDDEVKRLEGSIDDTNQAVSDLSGKLDDDISQTNEAFNQKIAEILNGDEGLLSKLDTVNRLIEENKQAISDNDAAIKESLAQEVDDLLESINSSKTSLEQKIDDNTTSITNSINEKDKAIRKDLAENVSGLQKSIDGQNQTIGDIQGGLSQAQSDIKTNTENLDGLKEVSLEIQEAFGVGSEYGTYAEAISNRMSVSAKNVIQEYEIISRLDSADEKATGFAEWINVTDSYIKTGILYTDSETGLEQVGIAIGTNISTSIVDGVVQLDSTKTDLLATFVSDALIFWQQGRKVAYLSNKKLYILSAEFLGSYRIGDFQWVSADIGLILEWVGEDSGE